MKRRASVKKLMELKKETKYKKGDETKYICSKLVEVK
jgi:hypothetical protein